MTDQPTNDTEERLRAHLAQAEAMRQATGGSGGLEGMLARISAETTHSAQERRQDAAVQATGVLATGTPTALTPTPTDWLAAGRAAIADARTALDRGQFEVVMGCLERAQAALINLLPR